MPVDLKPPGGTPKFDLEEISLWVILAITVLSIFGALLVVSVA